MSLTDIPQAVSDEEKTEQPEEDIEEIMLADTHPTTDADDEPTPDETSDGVQKSEDNIYVNKFFDTISAFGGYICGVLAVAIIKPVGLIAVFGKFLWKHTVLFRDALVRMFSALFKFIASPFLRTRRTLKISRTEIKKAEADHDRKTAFRIKRAIIKDALFGKHGLLVTVFNYAAPIIAVAFLFNIVNYVNSTSYAIKLSVNGKMMGYIESEQVYSDAERITNERITYAGGSAADMKFSPQYSLEMLGDQQYISKFQLANMMLEMSDANIEYALGMYIDGKFYGAISDNEPIDAEIQRILKSYSNNSKDEEIAIEQEITYEPGLFLAESIVPTDEIIKLLNSEKQQATYYTVVEGDSPSLISDKLDIPISTLEEYNPEITEEDYVMRAGKKLLLEQSVPFLSISVARTVEYEVNVPYDTENVTDDEHYEGVFTTLQEGEDGTNKVTARVYYVNGTETRRTIIKTETVKEPVSEIISEGTLPPQSSHYSDESVQYDKKYIWPVQGGTFWEWGYWDGGYAGHTGVDIGGAYGADVYAGASGVVTFAGWDSGGYGNMVMIEHEDGYTTLYGHNSEIYVSVGQYVYQGQCIAAVGQTGRAYGNHCHFEVRYGNERLNPRYYLNGL